MEILANNQTIFAEISPSEFFYRNRDLAGFSNPARALYSATRELVENSLDACESAKIMPKIRVLMRPLEEQKHKSDPRAYQLKIEDNGPGIEPKQVPHAFGRVFYGSKYKLRQARGMFGMGGTMSVLYGQITTSKPNAGQTPSTRAEQSDHRRFQRRDLQQTTLSLACHLTDEQAS